MTVTHEEVQVQWTGPADSLSIAAAGNATSLAFVRPSGAFGMVGLEVKADNDGTPAAGDTVDFSFLGTGGDPDGASTDEFATAGHGNFLATLNTNAEDPAVAYVWIPASFKEGKIRAVNNSAGRAITVSATSYFQKG